MGEKSMKFALSSQGCGQGCMRKQLKETAQTCHMGDAQEMSSYLSSLSSQSICVAGEGVGVGVGVGAGAGEGLRGSPDPVWRLY